MIAKIYSEVLMKINHVDYRMNCLKSLTIGHDEQVYTCYGVPSTLMDFKTYEYLARLLPIFPYILADDHIRNQVIASIAVEYTETATREYYKRACELKSYEKTEPAYGTFSEWYNVNPDSLNELVEHGCARPQYGHAMGAKIANGIIDLLNQSSHSTGKGKKDLVADNIDKIQEIFSLTKDETEIFILCIMRRNSFNVDKIIDRLLDLTTGPYRGMSFINQPQVIAWCTGIPLHDVVKCLLPTSTLRRCWLISSEGDPPIDLLQYIVGINNQPLEGMYFKRFRGGAIPLSMHGQKQSQINLLVDLLSKPQKGERTHILFHGTPGTGKTELAHSLATHLGLDTVEISQGSEAHLEGQVQMSGVESNTLFRFRAIEGARRLASTEKSLYIIDEADMLFTIEKTHINRALDNCEGCYIWITNSISKADPSTLRRFDYSIEFSPLTKIQRERVWESTLVQKGLTSLIDPEEVKLYAERYEISAGGVDVALRNIKRLSNSINVIPELLDAHVALLGFAKNSKQTTQLDSPVYSLEGLNITGNIQLAINAANSFAENMEICDKRSFMRNMTFLLYGAPGTGKTEFAKYLARSIGRKLIIKSVSDIQDKYVGETEKNLRRAFDEAEKEGTVLFFDEADSFLGSRDGAHNSWEVSQVNEMLSLMESFKGILICASNFEGNLDSASRRRFHFKLEFNYLDNKGKQIFWDIFFGNCQKSDMLDPLILKRLHQLQNLAPGDFKACYMRVAYLNAETRTPSICLAALEDEIRSKDGKQFKHMGF